MWRMDLFSIAIQKQFDGTFLRKGPEGSNHSATHFNESFQRSLAMNISAPVQHNKTRPPA